MNAYIDISFIFHLIICLTSIRFMKIISNSKLNKKQIIILEITSVVLYVNVLLFPNISIYLNLFYYILLFFIFFKGKFIVPLFTYLFSYYGIISIIRIFTSNIYFYKYIPMIFMPSSFFYVLISPLLLIIINLITKSIKSLIMLKKYRYNVKLTLNDKSYETSAYFDSGNTLKYKELPVIFLTNEMKDKNVMYERMLVNGIGREYSEYIKGKILFDNKEKDVYFAYVRKKSFNGCKCLLNVYLL